MIYAAKFVVPGRPFTRQDGWSRRIELGAQGQIISLAYVA
jgi:hypothetical protein